MSAGYLAPEPEVLRSPAVCSTPACRGPATIWRLGSVQLKVCQTCHAHYAVTDVNFDQAHAGGWPVTHANYNKET